MPAPKLHPDQPNEVIYLFEVGSTCTIDWGDNSPVEDVTTLPTYEHQYLDENDSSITKTYYVASHVYSSGDPRDVKIVGHIEGLTSGYRIDNPHTNHGLYNLIDFKQWGSLCSVKNIPRLLSHRATYTATDVPTFSYESDIRGLFALDLALGPNEDNLRVPDNISQWDVSNVFYIDDLFHAQGEFNHSLNGWNTQAFQSMNRTFKECGTYNKPMSLWNVENVNSADEFLRMAYMYDQDLSGWAAGNIQSCLNFAIDSGIEWTEKMPPLTCEFEQPE